MHINRLIIKNFRNLNRIDIQLDKATTCIIGENNVGKTNLLEAIRLVLDGSMSHQKRTLTVDDFSAGLNIATPQEILIAVYFTDFSESDDQKALVCNALLSPNEARIVYRFRPTIKHRIPNEPQNLTIADYAWDFSGGGDSTTDLFAIDYKTDIGTRFSVETLQQGFKLVHMEALRDVESRLTASRYSLLNQIISHRDLPEPTKGALTSFLATANNSIAGHQAVKDLAKDISTSFKSTSGEAHKMAVSVGLPNVSFADVLKQLNLLLSGYGLVNGAVSRNGLGLNNILYICLNRLLFDQQVSKGNISGQLLLIEEPEAHIHPQLQRALYQSIQDSGYQALISTHSTHITSSSPLQSYKVFSFSTTGSTLVEPSRFAHINARDMKDLERYLDATRSTLLFARKVLLVEGPAEMFLLPPLIKHIMKIDLDDVAIDIVPIYGTHFIAYAKLFGPTALARKCAILLDGDLPPITTDSSGELPVEETATAAAVATPDWRDALKAMENQHLKLFESETTLERELALPGNMQMFSKTCQRAGFPRRTASLALLHTKHSQGINISDKLTQAGTTILNAAIETGKGRFAQMASEFTSDAKELPEYIQEAVKWLLDDTANP